MRHAGIHWPANAGGEHPNVETILGMPGVRQGSVLICADSARYWYRQARGASPLVVWRSIPRQGRLPAQLGWEPNRVADECLNLFDEQPHGDGVEWLLPLNELQFPKENGGPFPGYGRMAELLAQLRLQLRRKLSQQYPGATVRLMFPSWVPMDDGDHLDDWRSEAAQWDAICLHAYGSAETMRARYDSYRAVFPGKLILVGEWNANHEGHDERAALQMWADVAAADPLFMGATYYIWETNNDGEHDLSIWGNSERLALFRDPPVAAVEPSQPDQPQPDEPEPAMPDFPLGIDVSNNNGGIDWPAVRAAGVQFAIAKATEGVNFADRFFAGNWSAMKANGIIRGAYHFARPSANGPEDEARFFWDSVRAKVGELEAGDLLALDLEDDRVGTYADLSAWTFGWLQEVERLAGFKPLCYTSPGYAQQHGLTNRPEIGDYGLWLASWGVPTPPQAPAPWSIVAIHQTGVGPAGTIAGVVGEIDLNRYNGPIDTLRLYGKPSAAPVPEPEFNVGGGILAAMQAHGDSPASDEVYVAHGDRDAWSEAYGASGARYVWLPSVGRVFRYDPAA